MRKYHKKLVLEMLESLTEANKMIREYFKKEQQENIVNILADSQGVIAQIAQFLSGDGQVEELIFLELDKYNQLLFLVSTEINAEHIKSLGTALTKLKKIMRVNLVAQQIELLFLPYNATMSDSLESVWRAAEKDPNCNVYIMPISYYEKDGKGNLTTEHNHSAFYQEETRIVSRDQYDFQRRHPDAIFIHNPYDGNNLVTSVHPDFYSENLKKHTESLVYVPYFVTGSSFPEHFCTVPGVYHADVVFLQSKKAKEIYQESEKKILKKPKKDKFIVAGSPKVDKVLYGKKEEYNLPQEWKDLMLTEEGNEKKVVFYNTSLGAILQYSEIYLERLKGVLDYFSKQTEVVLWWRPHPLSEETMSSMRPSLVKAYLDIVAQYKAEGFGIFDDSLDVHRAICYSDAYFGDSSSLLWLFSLKDCVVMQQSKDFAQLENIREFYFTEAWFEHLETNVLQQKPDWCGTLWEVGGGLSFLIKELTGTLPPEQENGRQKYFELKRQLIERYITLPEQGSGAMIYEHMKNIL